MCRMKEKQYNTIKNDLKNVSAKITDGRHIR